MGMLNVQEGEAMQDIALSWCQEFMGVLNVHEVEAMQDIALSCCHVVRYAEALLWGQEMQHFNTCLVHAEIRCPLYLDISAAMMLINTCLVTLCFTCYTSWVIHTVVRHLVCHTLLC